MVFGQSKPHGARNLMNIRVTCMAFDFSGQDYFLGAGAIDRESGAPARLQGRVAPLRRLLNVLRVVVAAVDNDQIFEPAGHEEIVALEETQVACAQEEGTIRS